MHVGERSRKVTTNEVDASVDEAPGRSSLGFAVVILAAGSASKRGSPTPLSPYRGRTLIEHVARTALNSGACEVVVVAGDKDEEIRRRLGHLPVRVVQNRQWQEGIAGSIRVGVSRLTTEPPAAVICLCDQPNITSDHIKALGKRALAPDGAPIVASTYDGVLGAPAAFASSAFPELLELKGEAGARTLIRTAGARVEAIGFDNANAELELPEPCKPPRPLRTSNIRTERFDRSRATRAPPTIRPLSIAV